MSALRIFIRFMHLRKLGLFFKTSTSLKPEFLTNLPQAKCFKIGLIIYLKTLPKCQKRKESKNRFFGAKKAQPVEEPVDRLWSSGRGPIEGGQKSSLSPSSFLFRVEVIPLPVEAMVTRDALNAPTASEPVNPQLDRTRLPLAIFEFRAQKPIN